MKSYFLIPFLFALILLSGCKAYKKIPYLEGASELTEAELANGKYTPVKIMPRDVLSITVSAPGREDIIKDYNLLMPVSQTTTSVYSQPVLQSYIVNEDGTINFPVLGLIKIGGMTKIEAENFIRDKIVGNDLKFEPIVTVQFKNFKVSVMGEVARPNTYTVANERITILEALALAGDLTIYGRRDNVLLIREDENGQVQPPVTINLQDKYLITSPYYYLKQNDMIYVEQNKTRGNASSVGSVESLTLTGVSILISVASLIVNILR